MAREWPAFSRVLAEAALAVAIVAGSAFLWVGIPVLGLWLIGELVTTTEGFLLAALACIPTSMVGFGWLLYRVNGLYQRVHGDDEARPTSPAAWLVSQSDERGGFRRARAPRPLIDVAMAASAVAALVLLVVWFFFFAEMTLVSSR